MAVRAGVALLRAQALGYPSPPWQVLAVAMGSTSFSASAADSRDQTIAELKAQLEALSAKVAELDRASILVTDDQIDPDLVERLRLGLPLAEADPASFYGGGDAGYVDHAPYEHTA